MTVRMSEEEYQKLQQQSGQAPEQLTAEELKSVSARYSQAVAIDPGKTTGLAWTNGQRVITNSFSDFWMLCGKGSTWYEMFAVPYMPNADLFATREDLVVILEAPYKSRPGMSADESAIAYRSGQVAREAELIAQRYETFLGYDLIEYDPARYRGGKWDSDYAHQVIGDWEGPDNDDVRDALRLLFFYNFL